MTPPIKTSSRSDQSRMIENSNVILNVQMRPCVLGVFLNIGFGSGFFPLSAFAQRDLPDTTFSADEKLLFQDIPSVYSASKYGQKITEAPSSISMVTAEEIKKYGYRTMADLLASLRGIFTTNDRTYQFLGIRGFVHPSDFNTRALVLTDGHRTNEAMDDSSAIGNEDHIFRGVYVHRKKGIPTAPYETVVNDNGTDILDALGHLDLRYEHDFEDQTKVVGRLFYDNYYYSGDYVYDVADPGDPPDFFVNQDKALAQWWGSEFWVTKRLFGNHRLTAGGEFRQNLQQDQKDYDRTLNLNDNRDSVNWEIYLQDEVEILENVRLSLGVRYDHFPTFGSTTNPRLGLIYNPFSGTNLKFLYKTAFRASNVYEKYYHDGFNTKKPNPNLDPETIETFEFIVEQALGGSLRGTASLFYNRIDNLITFVTDPNDGLLFNKNLQDAETLGVEVGLEGKIMGKVDSRISYSFQNTEDRDTGVKLSNSPAHLAKPNLIAPLYQETLFGSLGTQYMRTRKTLAGTHTDDYLITNLSLFSRFKNIPVFGSDWIRGLEVSGTVHNLFDQNYGDPGSEEHLQNQIPQDGRTYRVKLPMEL